jgi:xylan 1,4-beta-xylosidase
MNTVVRAQSLPYMTSDSRLGSPALIADRSCQWHWRPARGWRRLLASSLGAAVLLYLGTAYADQVTDPSAVAELDAAVIDASAATRPFPHFWEQMFGSGRAILTLRERYRADLREIKGVTDFRYVRFHNILHDEVGVYDEDALGTPIYNFSYVDQIYDGLLQNGVRPFVEISFMPSKLALRQDVHPFWYRQIVSPPKDYGKWDELIRKFASHLVERYGLDEVSQWYFEVWNEPNIDFWSGEPKQSTYFELYDHTARALKSVSARLRVGGPATSSAHWVDDFLQHAEAAGVATDFVSSHAYGDDTVENLFGNHEAVPVDQRVCRAIRKVHEQIGASARPTVPLFWTEWNVPSFGALKARSTAYVGAGLAEVIAQCDGLVDMMSYWTFSQVFEENGPGRVPFNGGFGLMTLGGIRTPGYTAFALLHRLGGERLAVNAPGILATRRADGSLAVAIWNLVDPDRPDTDRAVQLSFRNLRAGTKFKMTQIDNERGNSYALYNAMGKPTYPSAAQLIALNKAAEVPASQAVVPTADGSITLSLHANALLLLEAK